MEANLVQWLDAVGSRVFGISVALLLALNGFGIAMVIFRQDRAMVNRWTPRFLAANLVLLGPGVGAPLATSLAQVAVRSVAPMFRHSVPTVIETERDDNGDAGAGSSRRSPDR